MHQSRSDAGLTSTLGCGQLRSAQVSASAAFGDSPGFWYECTFIAWLGEDVRTSPWLVINQLSVMARADFVVRKQYFLRCNTKLSPAVEKTQACPTG
jgi:hypothetical protein